MSRPEISSSWNHFEADNNEVVGKGFGWFGCHPGCSSVMGDNKRAWAHSPLIAFNWERIERRYHPDVNYETVGSRNTWKYGILPRIMSHLEMNKL